MVIRIICEVWGAISPEPRDTQNLRYASVVKRFAVASVVVVLVLVAVLLLDGLVAELSGYSLPGELAAVLASFLAAYAGGRIGGRQYFWLGIPIFLALQIWSFFAVFNAVRDIELSANGESTLTWAGVLADSWPTQVLTLLVAIAGLVIGGHGSSTKGHQQPDTA